MSTVFVYIANWFGLAAIALANETVRERVYGPRMPEILAQRLSTIVGFVLSTLYIAFLTGIAPIASGRLALLVGLTWLVMAIVFESLLQRIIDLHHWNRLHRDRRVFSGVLWVLVLLWTWALRLL